MQIPPSRTGPLLAFILTVAVALSFALYTNHAWEDYYITYRSSKNLATGHGLVFNHGDKLHTFTSPLGVLLPSVSYLLTGCSSDIGALWVFRGMCLLALGGAAALLTTLSRRLAYPVAASVALVGFIALDAKSLDFTINGMETAFMLLFLAYAVWAHFKGGEHRARHLGFAWGGLMWTRPDSFIYVGLLAAGFWLFHPGRGEQDGRRRLLWDYLRAGTITTAVYLPWLVWAGWYYGTPVPHTITAKSGIGDPHTVKELLRTLVELPWLAAQGKGSLELTYLPSYYMIGGWPQALIVMSRWLAIAGSLLWLVPRLRLETRAASFAFFGAHVYLTYFPYFPFPWYIPSTTLLAGIAWGGVAAQLLAPGTRPWIRWGVMAGLAGFLAVSGWTAWQVAREVEAQQRLVEDGNRRKIGEWLHEHARPGDTVFMEPLGYIGYFSGLKTYDFPGMSSREMVNARKMVGLSWAALINYLQPHWVVLRPFELRQVSHAGSPFEETYVHERNFDASDAVKGLDVHGRPYLEVDSHFMLFRRIIGNRLPAEVEGITAPYPMSRQTEEGIGMMLIHAPGKMVIKVPPGASHLRVHYGFSPPAYTGTEKTDGALFQVEVRGEHDSALLLSRRLEPSTKAEDRGLQKLEVDLPAFVSGGAVLIFRTSPGATMTKDWTLWSEPDIH